MSIAERIIKEVQEMPKGSQAEVLNFLEFLKFKEARLRNDSKDSAWCAFSISQAMREMEDEPDLYSATDLKEVFASPRDFVEACEPPPSGACVARTHTRVVWDQGESLLQ